MYENKVTFHSAANATATGTVMTTTAISLVSVQITGTFVATVTFKGSIDGTNYVALEAINRSTGAKATTATAAGLYSIPVVGCRKFICDLTWSSGTSITVTGIGQENGNTLLPDVELSAASVNIGDIDVLTTVHPVGLSTVAVGERQGSATAVQMPTVSAKFVRVKAVVSNAGNVYLGGSGVTKPDGTTDTTTGLELAPGDDSGWLPASNLNVFYIICDNATDDVTYMVLA